MNVFVYGSLRRGFYNWELYLKNKSTDKGEAKTKGTLYHQPKKGYPAMIEGDSIVYGELFSLQDFKAQIIPLDKMENYEENNKNNEYVRKIITVTHLETGKEEEAYAYIYVRQDLGTEENPSILLPQGDWKTFMQRENKGEKTDKES